MTDRGSRFERPSKNLERTPSRASSIASNRSYNYYAENASQEIFDGPTSESIPSSYTSMHHRRRYSSISRPRDRTAADAQDNNLDHFKFFSQTEVENAEGASTVDQDMDPVEYERYAEESEGEEPFPLLSNSYQHQHVRRYSYESASQDDLPKTRHRRQSSSASRHRNPVNPEIISIISEMNHDTDEDDAYFDDTQNSPLLGPQESYELQDKKTSYETSQRFQQRFYISEEDLVIFLAGYKSSRPRQIAYYTACVLSLGLVYIVLRWFPRLQVSCVGVPCSLGACDWLVIENQWGELEVINIEVARYRHSIWSVFKKDAEDEERENSFGNRPDNGDDVSDISEFHKNLSLPYLRSFSYRYIRFYYHPLQDIFKTNMDWVDSHCRTLSAASEGLDIDEYSQRRSVFGANALEIAEKSNAALLVDEVLHPFYVFQVFSILLWSLDEYYYYAFCIFIISLLSVLDTLIATKKALSRLQGIANFECDVRVLRSGYWTTVPSSDLVPGDVFEVSDPGLTLLPCDSLLLSGDVIVNESMLTGESVPVSKFPSTEEALRDLIETSKVSPVVAPHYLFSGTQLVRVRGDTSVAVVVRTGFHTTKGALLRSMMFPRPSKFKFYRDSFRYIGVMAMIAVCGFVVSTINFIRMGIDTKLIIFRALDIVTIVVPPALPATLSIGTNISLARLRKKSIFCIAPSRVNVGGRVDVMCFDKTGTLTEDGLDVLGLIPVNEGRKSFSVHHEQSSAPSEGTMLRERRSNSKMNMMKSQPSDYNQNDDAHNLLVKKEIPYLNIPLTQIMATCHSLKHIDGKLVGDPLDEKMFEATGWSFDEENSRLSSNESLGEQIQVLRLFDFDASLRRMSVVTGSHVFVKGAPEIMPEICNELPANYMNVLNHYTHSGFRVIGCGYRDANKNDVLSSAPREDVEVGFNFAGFIVFENKLKDITASVIAKLSDAKIRTVMCTGDNVLTAISVGRDCGILANEAVYLPHFHDMGEGNAPYLQWKSSNGDEEDMLDATMRTKGGNDYSLAVTGDAFRYLIEFGSTDQVEQMLARGSIFARMSPDEKHELIEKLQGIGYTAGFCGDGANDCGALKAADIGVSLSEAEASVAAPFTSRIFDISCVLDVIKEGRCALTTSFSCFKYMSLYSAIQFISVSILYNEGSNLGDFQFLFIDLCLIVPIAIFMAWAQPFPKLSVKRPTANLVSPKVLTPLIGQILILLVFQLIVWRAVKGHSWYIPPIRGGSDEEVVSSDNTALFDMSCFQYIFIAVVLSAGPPYREPMYKNVAFLIVVAITILLSVAIMCTEGSTWLGRLMDLSYTPAWFNWMTIGLAFVNFCLSYLAETYLFPSVARLFKPRHKERKRYKELMEPTEV